jgi:hypothetical protein
MELKIFRLLVAELAALSGMAIFVLAALYLGIR